MESKKIRIFGEDFIKNNKNKCKLLIDNKEKELCHYINMEGKKEIKIKLKEIKTNTNMSYMFEFCPSLSSFPDIIFT